MNSLVYVFRVAMEDVCYKSRELPLLISAMIVVLAATGCTVTQGRELQYQPTPAPAKSSDAKSPPVAVEVTDRRPSEVIQTNDTNWPLTTQYVPKNNVPDLLKSAFVAELKSRGFVDGAGGNSLSVTVLFFRSNSFHGEGFATDTFASIGLNIIVKRPDGSVAYVRLIEGRSKPWQAEHRSDAGFWHRHPITEAVEAAIQDALAKVFSDPAFIEALKTG